MKLDYHPEAVREYERSVNYYKTISPRLAARFIDEIQTCIALIKEAPQRWKRLRGEVRAVQAAIFPFQVLYSVKQERIIILAVMHESRHPDYWTDRLN